ncbi:hypothetical protein Kpol_1044p29 [Vanderwaltozyma polyspora DSM 70294]|uniref:Zinc/cadmium resistance protein n=1 Tax=Vanderwaltozyma polyspora (strain ATCC 22028 / DSM 70294 / BCRC 21397 / CBS 2163 / NBRC 10782 / NRRL Y-8283 / UCD 57-17) TaxID=436907 RepID=A7TP59_VANPO|nr:uncharacterized protein Kpol_1044p29 [Vanderwaltozyma polyspora DSM 70294]EDO15969.1 hypothetical protein Kpol_1044p29 [Vanderwaltozyma polyspora DSM 70294]
MSGKEIRIVSLLILDTIFFLLELIIGYLSHSLALIADSFHMLNDIISLIVALWAVNVAKNRSPDAKYTYGWKRAEILGALINAVFLMALCFSILIEALQRLIEPQEINNPKLVLYVGCAGLISNIVGLFLFHDVGHGGHSHSHNDDEENSNNTSLNPHLHDAISSSTDNINDVMPQNVVARESSYLLGNGTGSHNNNNHSDSHNHSHADSNHDHSHGNTKNQASHGSLNMHGVFLHVLGDALGNIGVIIAALFIWKTDYSWKYYTDPIVSLVITIIIFSSALPLSRKASKILLQATPSTISADSVQRDILAIPGVISVHDLHIWNLTESVFIASVHVQVDSTPDKFTTVAKLIRDVFHNYNIHSATVQPEFASGNVTSEQSRKFSLLAGGNPHGPNSASSLDSLSQSGRSAYGSTAVDRYCLVDEVSNCNTSDCLPK